MAIRRVSVLTTGEVRIRPQHVESDGTPMLWWLNTTRRWTGPRPINVYVIEHDQGLVLFDTGQDRRSILSPDYFPKGLFGHFFRRLARFAISAEETLPRQLAELGYDIDDVRVAILSHLHQDHIGGLPDLTHAEILVSAADWAEVPRRSALLSGVMRDHILLPGLRWTPIDLGSRTGPGVPPFPAAHDLFGDGTLVLVPTPGHTPGSVSLLLRSEGLPPMLFVGDLTYDVGLLREERVPGVGRRSALLRSTRLVNDFVRRNPGTLVLAAHDPGAAAVLQAATSGPAPSDGEDAAPAA